MVLDIPRVGVSVRAHNVVVMVDTSRPKEVVLDNRVGEVETRTLTRDNTKHKVLMEDTIRNRVFKG